MAYHKDTLHESREDRTVKDLLLPEQSWDHNQSMVIVYYRELLSSTSLEKDSLTETLVFEWELILLTVKCLPITDMSRHVFITSLEETSVRPTKTTDFLYGHIDPAVASSITVAVHNLLDQHDRYNVIELTKYLQTYHPDVPKEICEILV